MERCEIEREKRGRERREGPKRGEREARCRRESSKRKDI